MMIRIAICDDNQTMLKRLHEYIEQSFLAYTDDMSITTYSNGITLINAHKIQSFNVIFLDIDMPQTTGFDVAKYLRNELSHSLIIFVTSHDELVYQSMDFQPFHFIRKNTNIPLNESINKIVGKIMIHMKQNKKIILEDDISGRCAVPIHNVVYIECKKHYLYYYIINKSEMIKMRGTMQECEENLSLCDFVRIHRSFLINLRYLSRFDSKNNEVYLGEIKKKLPMSQSYKNDVDKKYTIYLRSKV